MFSRCSDALRLLTATTSSSMVPRRCELSLRSSRRSVRLLLLRQRPSPANGTAFRMKTDGAVTALTAQESAAHIVLRCSAFADAPAYDVVLHTLNNVNENTQWRQSDASFDGDVTEHSLHVRAIDEHGEVGQCTLRDGLKEVTSRLILVYSKHVNGHVTRVVGVAGKMLPIRLPLASQRNTAGPFIRARFGECAQEPSYRCTAA